MPDEPVPDDAAGLRAANARLRDVVAAKDAEIAGLRLELDAVRERERRTELRLAELERRLGMDSSNSGTPSSKERIGAKEKRARQQSERGRSKDRRRGGQPGIPGRAWSGTRSRMSARTPPRRRSAAAAGLAWTARHWRGSSGHSPGTCGSPAW